MTDILNEDILEIPAIHYHILKSEREDDDDEEEEDGDYDDHGVGQMEEYGESTLGRGLTHDFEDYSTTGAGVGVTRERDVHHLFLGRNRRHPSTSKRDWRGRGGGGFVDLICMKYTGIDF